MVRLIKQSDVIVGSAAQYCEYAGLAKDDKPTDDFIATGSLFREVDTGDVYAYDEVSSTWNIYIKRSSDE